MGSKMNLNRYSAGDRFFFWLAAKTGCSMDRLYCCCLLRMAMIVADKLEGRLFKAPL